MANPTKPDLISYEQAAEPLDPERQLGITKLTIRRLVTEGALQKVKVGRHPALFRKQILEMMLPPQAPLAKGPARRRTKERTKSEELLEIAGISYKDARQLRRKLQREGKNISERSAFILLLDQQRRNQ